MHPGVSNSKCREAPKTCQKQVAAGRCAAKPAKLLGSYSLRSNISDQNCRLNPTSWRAVAFFKPLHKLAFVWCEKASQQTSRR